MTVQSNSARKQLHLHLPLADYLTEASLMAPSGEKLPLEMRAHDAQHYLLRWQPDLPAGLYHLKVRSQSGESLTQALRIS